jgi:hypothetical protein
MDIILVFDIDDIRKTDGNASLLVVLRFCGEERRG